MTGIANRYGRRALGATLVVGVGLALSGCALGLGEFSKTAAKPVDNPYMKEAVLQEDAVPLKPAALIEEEVAPATEPTPAAAAAATVVPTNRYPNLNVVPPSSKTKLLSAEEKAKVIAELEGLARRQGASMAKERATSAAACDNLSAEELRKKMAQGGC